MLYIVMFSTLHHFYNTETTFKIIQNTKEKSEFIQGLVHCMNDCKILATYNVVNSHSALETVPCMLLQYWILA